MARSILSLLVGYLITQFLLIFMNIVILAVKPGAFGTDGSVVPGTAVLIVMLIFSVFFTVIAGYTTGVVARRREARHGLYLGILMLALGLYYAVSTTHAAPWWNYLNAIFALPAAWFGGVLRERRVAVTAMTAESVVEAVDGNFVEDAIVDEPPGDEDLHEDIKDEPLAEAGKLPEA